ncbi:uncharacterized protein involved in exopolysaccharide biosynthesis/Mrp family chromosome partitioning ATPase [Novosphingobium hassiacum]|uniref:Uncharacterized protein involved in exopolysaccharide biosynthesis/Mrp family chromosome partitioning ATPase n=1 Tax=Novosphingobium hassiacum TaxID=173676 RepID=A0A7W5ZYV5_9SPHN|nr:uncharacterized protein involved in exopolysaccharide biosynthesis/Mrp family chromosome partitioning ATPase [Novosphingobium hassiacum]
MSDLVIQRGRAGRGRLVRASASPVDAFNTSNEQFGLKDLLRVIVRHRAMLLIVVGFSTLATLAWQLTAQDKYSATANVQVELIDDVGTNQADVQAKNVQRIANEVKLYRSRAVAEKVAEDLSDKDLNRVLKGAGSDPDGSRDKRIALATSAIQDMMSIQAEEGSDLIEVTAVARTPKVAALIANSYPLANAALKNEKNNGRRGDLLASLNSERKKRAKQAAEAAEALADYRLSKGMFVGSGTAEDLQQINRIAAEAASAQAMRAGSAAQSAAVARAAQINTTANATSPVLQALERQEADLAAEYARLSPTYGENYPEVARLTAQLGEVRRRISGERERAVSIAAQVANTEAARLTQMSRGEANRDAARAGQLEGIVGRLTSLARNNTANTVQLEELDRAANVSAKAYTEIAERISQVRSEMLVGGVTSTLISPAIANDDRVSPTPLKMTVLAFMASSLLGLLLVFARELMDDKLRTVSQVRRLFSLPTFGMLPILSDGGTDKFEDSPVIADPQSLFAEVARSSLAEVSALAPKDKSQSVLITSPLPGDGKSVVTLTLAAAAMVMGKRVVIVDLDLRKASILQQIHRELNSPELLDVLRGKVDLKSLSGPASRSADMPANYGESEIDFQRLTLLSTTSPISQPAALLASGRIHRLIEDCKARYDLVLINAPATLAVRDARTMCEFADETVIVARWGVTTIDQMRATLELLGQENIAGVLFNQVDYAEHARRRYGDSIEFYIHAADYYQPPEPARWGSIARIRKAFGRNHSYA